MLLLLKVLRWQPLSVLLFNKLYTRILNAFSMFFSKTMTSATGGGSGRVCGQCKLLHYVYKLSYVYKHSLRTSQRDYTLTFISIIMYDILFKQSKCEQLNTSSSRHSYESNNRIFRNSFC